MRVGLIAMSGIRVCDPELARLGMTLPGFVERGRVIASLPSLGLLTLAGMPPKACRLEYIEVRDLATSEEIVPERFDLVAISNLTAQIEDAYRGRALPRRGRPGGARRAACEHAAGRGATALRLRRDRRGRAELAPSAA